VQEGAHEHESPGQRQTHSIYCSNASLTVTQAAVEEYDTFIVPAPAHREPASSTWFGASHAAFFFGVVYPDFSTLARGKRRMVAIAAPSDSIAKRFSRYDFDRGPPLKSWGQGRIFQETARQHGPLNQPSASEPEDSKSVEQ
jgi:hypothetical protein